METTMDSRAVDRMATSVPRGDAAARCADVLGALSPAALPEVAVLDGERFVGLVRLERLLGAAPDTTLGALVDPNPAKVLPDADQEAVAWAAAHRNARAVALGLAGAMLSAGIVAGFEDQLRNEVLLAFFVPAVVYMADAVGTQTEAVVIRGMALGVSLRSIAFKELATGFVIGVLLACAFFAFALGVWGAPRVAVAVAVALFVSASIATLVAMLLPYALARLGRDPAFGSGPLATVIQDLLSILVYFAVASILV